MANTLQGNAKCLNTLLIMSAEKQHNTVNNQYMQYVIIDTTSEAISKHNNIYNIL